MGKVINFPLKGRANFELKKVRKGKRKKDTDQLDLFSSSNDAEVRSIHGSFEDALISDQQGGSNTEELYLKAVKQGDYPADAYCNLGILEYHRGEKAKAIERFTLALQEDPRHFESHYNIGNLYFDVENYPLSVFHYQVALEIQPDYPPIYFNMALAQASMNNISEAIVTLEHYLKLEDSQEAHSLLAQFTQLSSNF